VPYEINYLKALGAPFKNFDVITVDVATTVKDIVKLYDILNGLASSGIADCEFKGGTLYVKGDIDKAMEALKSGGFILSEKRETLTLTPTTLHSRNIIKALFYKALSRYAMKHGFTVFRKIRRGRKRIIPQYTGSQLEKLKDEKLADIIQGKIIVLRGIQVLLDIFESGEAILWVDLYTPIIDLESDRPLSPREAKKQGLQEKYVRYIPFPRERYDLVMKLLNKLCRNGKLVVTFADGFSIEFECKFPRLLG